MTEPGDKPLVAIVGRPNVGKSTLFNRLAGRPDAIVSDVAGTTRDRVTAETVWADRSMILVDTGGLEVLPETDMWRMVKAQVEMAVAEADVIIMLVDASTGLTPGDSDVGDTLRPTGKRVLVAANKADNEQRRAVAPEFYELGLGEPVPVSAFHNLGIDELMERVVALFPEEPEFPGPDADMRLAIVGRVNVGKSMLLNTITGQERAIVSEIPGTTRDALDTALSHAGRRFLIIDTAGIRRRGKVERGIERYSVLRAIRAIDRADVAVVVIDATELATSQDSHIVSHVLDAYKGIVLVVNKWDLASELGLTREDAVRLIRAQFRFIAFAPVCFTSALRGSGIGALLTTVQEVHAEWNKSLPRYDVRRTVMSAVAEHPPATSGRGKLKIFGVSQDQTGPPSFTFFVNRPDMVHFSYRRYLENTLREAYQFKGSPLRMRFKGKGEK